MIKTNRAKTGHSTETIINLLKVNKIIIEYKKKDLNILQKVKIGFKPGYQYLCIVPWKDDNI